MARTISTVRVSRHSPIRLWIPLALLTIVICALAPAEAAVRGRPFRVVIDPGHGGVDHGTIYESGQSRIMEKDATLLLAQQVARQLRAKGFSVILTRTQDVEVPLGQRTAIANRLGADVFLSIHMNSTQESEMGEAEGLETYILNNTTDASSRRLAQLENTVLSPEVRASDNPEQIDVALILRDLRLDANTSESKRLACMIQRNLVSVSARPGLVSRAGRRSRQRDRGVKQALFHVLLGAEMPSVLVEAGFLSHSLDREMILEPAGRRAMAAAIARAVEDFRDTRDTPEALSTLSRCKVH